MDGCIDEPNIDSVEKAQKIKGHDDWNDVVVELESSCSDEKEKSASRCEPYITDV